MNFHISFGAQIGDDSFDSFLLLTVFEIFGDIVLDLFERESLGFLLVGHFDDVPSELRADGFGDGINFGGKSSVGELGDHAVFGEEVQIARILFGGGIFGEFGGQSSEVFSAFGFGGEIGGCFLFFGDGGFIRIFIDADKNVAGTDDFRLREFGNVFLIEFFDIGVAYGGGFRSLGFHPFALAEKAFDAGFEIVNVLTGGGEFLGEAFLGTVLLGDLGQLFIDFGIGHCGIGGGGINEFVHDEIFDELTVEQALLLGGEHGRLESHCAKNFRERGFKLLLGNRGAVDFGDRIREIDDRGGLFFHEDDRRCVGSRGGFGRSGFRGAGRRSRFFGLGFGGITGSQESRRANRGKEVTNFHRRVGTYLMGHRE